MKTRATPFQNCQSSVSAMFGALRVLQMLLKMKQTVPRLLIWRCLNVSQSSASGFQKHLRITVRRRRSWRRVRAWRGCWAIGLHHLVSAHDRSNSLTHLALSAGPCAGIHSLCFLPNTLTVLMVDGSLLKLFMLRRQLEDFLIAFRIGVNDNRVNMMQYIHGVATV